MPIPSRDRLPRPVDISTLYRGAARKVDLIVDKPGLNWKGLSEHGLSNVSRGGSYSSGTGRAVRVGGARRGQGRSIQRLQITGQQNRTPRVIGLCSVGGGRRQGVNWPSWYRRRPLQDITALMEAIESRRAELYQTREAQQEKTNELEQEIGSRTPLPTVFAKAQPSTSTQALNKAKTGNFESSSDLLTPEKRLLNSIEKLRGFWVEDQKRLARTPDAKKAERQKKVRTLMSMR